MIFQQMSLMLQNLVQDEEGQGLVEYALILVLVSVVAIVALGLVGDQIVIVFDQITAALGGA